MARLHLNNAMVLPNTGNNLVSLGLLASDHGITAHIGSGPDGSYLELPDKRRVILKNDGALVIPDAPPEVVLAAVAKDPENGRDHSTWSLIHNRFNGRAYDTLRHLITCGTGVTRDWHRAPRHLPRSPCLSCLQSRAEKIPSRAHVPPALVPG